MKLKFYYVRKEFLLIMIGLFFVLFSAFVVADRERFSGPRYWAPETDRAVSIFKNKCHEYNISDICDQGFENLVRIKIVNQIKHIKTIKDDTVPIGLAEFSLFSAKTKISIDSRIMTDRVLFDSTVIHELGHAILDLDHYDDKLAIMNSTVNDIYEIREKYDFLVDDMFKDFKDSLN